MTVGELRKKLSAYHDEVEVLVQDADDNVWDMVGHLYEDEGTEYVYVVASASARVRWVTQAPCNAPKETK